MSQLAVEILPGERRAVRRAVALECSVLSEEWDEAAPHLLTDLSPFGAWLETSLPLEPGSTVLLSFLPPRQTRVHELLVSATVARAHLRRRRDDGPVAGMGVRFTDLSPAEFERLSLCLRGLPPPLPGYASRLVAPCAHGAEWLDVAAVAEDDIDVFALADDDIEFLPAGADASAELYALAPLVTGGTSKAERRRFKRAS